MKLASLKMSSRGWSAALSALAFAAMASVAHADPVLVNGGFEQTLTPNSSQFGSLFPSQQVTGWTTGGYNFVFTPGTADTTGAPGQAGNVQLWGPGNGSSNGLSVSPAGGNFVALDGGFEVDALSQLVTGLIVGAPTKVSFFWGGVQQFGFSGATTDQLQVSLGSEILLTPVLSVADHGFSGWKSGSLTFTPTSTSEVLSFLAIGTPSGVPPFALLDGVTVATVPTPEPGSLALFSTGILGLAGYVGRRYKKANADQA
jgi:hypothetical protein